MKQITAIFSHFNIYIHFKRKAKKKKLYQPHLKDEGNRRHKISFFIMWL